MKKYLLLLLFLGLSLLGKGQNSQIDSVYQLAQEYLSQKDSFLYGQTLYKVWDGNPYDLSPEEIEVVKQKTYAFGVDYGFKPAEANLLIQEGRYQDAPIELYYQIQVLEEADPTWSYEAVRSRDFSYNSTYPDLSADTAHWMKIDLHGPANQPDTFLFRVGGLFRSWERVDLYYEKGDSIIHQKLGYDKLSQGKTTIGSHNYFELPLPMDETITLYVRVDGKSLPYSASQLQLFYYPGARLIDRQYYSSDGQFPSLSDLNRNYLYCSEYLHLLADSAGDLRLEEAQEKFRNGAGFPNGTHAFERDGIYWGRMLLKGNDSFWGEQEFQLGGNAFGSFAKIDVFYQDKDGSLVHLKTGSSRPIFQKPIPYERSFVELKVPPKDTLEVLFRFEQKNRYFQNTSGQAQAPIFIAHYSQSYLESNLPWRTFRKGITLGGLGLITVYFFLFFLIERSWLYFYLSLFVLGFFTYFFVTGPVAVDTGNTDWVLLRAMLSYFLGFVGFYLFTVEYLNLKALKKRLWHVLSGLFIVEILLTLLMVYPILQGVTPPTWLFSGRTVFQILFFVLCLVLAILSLLKGHRPAIFYLLAFAGFFLFIINTSGRFIMGSLPNSSMLYMNSQFEISILVVPIFLALGMGYRSRLLQKERTDAIRAEEIAKIQAAAAEEASESKSNFLSTVSHELRTPLTSVLGFAKIIRKRFSERVKPMLPTDDKKLNRTVDQIEKNLDVVVLEGERLTNLINDVLDLAKIESGRTEWHLEPVDLNGLVHQAYRSTSALFDIKGLDYQENFAADLPLVSGDKDKLIQVMVNLLSNAVKFTETGSIMVSTKKENNQIIVGVQDTGIGIAPENLPKVFEKFRQVGDTLTDKPQGTGLGLPICQEIIEHLGGQIWAESNFGEGSLFSFSLPLKQAAQGAKEDTKMDELIQELKKKMSLSSVIMSQKQHSNILVVDDDPSIRELLRQELSDTGYEVTLAENGKQALQKVRAQRPDMIILDVMMPELNGFDLAAILKNDPETLNIPILILSIVEDKERGYRIGVDRYLNKPIDTDLLLSEVETLLNRGTSSKKVLVIDDSQSTAASMASVLSAKGFEVMEAAEDSLIEVARATMPDVIILHAALNEQKQLLQTLRFEKGLESVLIITYQ